MPRRHLKRGDPGGSPLWSEVIEIGPRAIGRIEPQIRERLRKIGKAFVPLLARCHRDPQHGPFSTVEPRHEWRVLPFLAGKDAGLLTNFENRNIRRFLPYNVQLWRTKVLDAANIYSGAVSDPAGAMTMSA